MSPRPGRWSGVVAWALWALGMLCLVAIARLDHLLRQAGRVDLAPLGAAVAAPVLAAVSALTVGAVLASRRPRHPVGWLLLALGVCLNASGVFEAYADYGLQARPGALPAAEAAARYLPAPVVAGLACVGFILLLTPSGSLPSRRWRWWAWTAAALPAISLLVVALAPRSSGRPYQGTENPFDLRGLDGLLATTYQVALFATILAAVVAAGSLVGRFRRAHGVERQQLRWVALAAAMMALTAVVVLATLAVGATGLLGYVAGIWIVFLPLGIGAAVLRYRLYDLDRIISRTLAYGLLTVLLGGGYAVVVLGLGGLLGRDSSLVVAGATLAVAGAFQPARRRVQATVDRRFNRRRYDAAMTVAAFSERLRQQVDLDTLTAEVLAVVDETMQPTEASLWLRPVVTGPDA